MKYAHGSKSTSECHENLIIVKIGFSQDKLGSASINVINKYKCSMPCLWSNIAKIYWMQNLQIMK